MPFCRSKAAAIISVLHKTPSFCGPNIIELSICAGVKECGYVSLTSVKFFSPIVMTASSVLLPDHYPIFHSLVL